MPTKDTDRELLEMVNHNITTLSTDVKERFNNLEGKFDSLSGDVNVTKTDVAVLKSQAATGSCAGLEKHKVLHKEESDHHGINIKWAVGIIISVVLSILAIVSRLVW